jgi:transposase-like protein
MEQVIMNNNTLQQSRRKRYSSDFKEQAVLFLARSGKPISKVAGLLGVDRTNLQKWKKKLYHPLVSCGSPELYLMQKEIDSMILQLQAIMKKASSTVYNKETKTDFPELNITLQ